MKRSRRMSLPELTLSKISCQKCKIFSDSTVRNKKSHVKSARWRVPDCVRRSSDEDGSLSLLLSKGELDIRGLKHSNLVGSRFKLNEFDKDTIYGKPYEITKGNMPKGHKSSNGRNAVHSLHTPIIKRKGKLKAGKQSPRLPVIHSSRASLTTLSNGSKCDFHALNPSSVGVGKGCHSCDIFGTNFCEQCKRRLSFDKMKEVFHSGSRDISSRKRRRYINPPNNGENHTFQGFDHKSICHTRKTAWKGNHQSGVIIIPTGLEKNSEIETVGTEGTSQHRIPQRRRTLRCKAKIKVKTILSKIDEESL